MMETAMTRLKVTGMTCGHCEAAVKKALEAVPGVTAVARVDRNDGVAEVEGAADVAALIAAVVEEGYTAEAA
jgi:copper chaperone